MPSGDLKIENYSMQKVFGCDSKWSLSTLFSLSFPSSLQLCFSLLNASYNFTWYYNTAKSSRTTPTFKGPCRALLPGELVAPLRGQCEWKQDFHLFSTTVSPSLKIFGPGHLNFVPVISSCVQSLMLKDSRCIIVYNDKYVETTYLPDNGRLAE